MKTFLNHSKSKTIIVVSNWENTEKWAPFYQAFEENEYNVKILCFSNSDIKSALVTGRYFIDFRKINYSQSSAVNTHNIGWDDIYSLRRVGGAPNRDEIQVFKKKVNQIILEHNPVIFFGEKTWPHELFINLIAKKSGIKYLSPICVRIPDKYFYLSSELELPEFSEGSLSELEVSDGINQLIQRKPPKYSRTQMNGIPRKERLISYIHSIRSLQAEAYSRPNVWHRIKSGCQKYVNNWAAHRIPIVANSKFCYFVHVQPEASIDILGNGLRSNQTIFDWVSYSIGQGKIEIPKTEPILSVKFHSSFRGRWETINLSHLNLPQIVQPSNEILDRGIIPITVSGTIAIEALVAGIRPIVLGSPFFKNAPGIITVNSCQELSDAMSYSDYKWQSVDSTIEYMQSTYKKCFNINQLESISKYVKKIKGFS